MGGGDLNLKKSWHPSTMKNMEKVWKAEQQDNQEKKRIAELKREIEMEKDKEDMTRYAMDQGVIEKKDDKKLDWMYKGPNQAVNREDYLLGKAIDKPFEQMAQAEKDTELNRAPKNHVEYECIPPSLRFFSGNEQVDLQRKLQEDPLYAIKKKEMETRSQLLKNPVKLKQLKQMLEEQAKQSKNEKRSKRKKKSKMKNKHDSGDSDSDLDNLLAAKYNKLKNKISEKDLIKSMKKHKKDKKKKHRSRSSSSSSSMSDDEDEAPRSREKISEKDLAKSKKHKKEKKKKHRRRSSSSSSDSSSDEDQAPRSREKKKKKSKSNTDEGEKYRKQSKQKGRSRSPKHETNSIDQRDARDLKRAVKRRKDPGNSDSDDDRRKPAIKGNYGLVRADGTKILASSKLKSGEAAKQSEKQNEEKRWVAPKRERLTEEEKERRRQEMLTNASWRDKERERNVKRYRDEEKKETTDKTYNKDFIRKQLAVAAEVGTVESRIKANINNIQRSRRAMDSNFAKR